MRCPRCEYQSPYETVRCPSCTSTFAADPLEELGHLTYLQGRLHGWRDQGAMPAAVAEGVLALTQLEVVELGLRLGLASTAAAATAEPPSGAVVSAQERPADSTGPVASAERDALGRPSFSWRRAGTYLLSEQTLNALLGLGAFLILASGVVISTLNPTGLPPLPHLAAVAATTALFYGAGYVVRQKLRLARAGTTLLAIGGAFVPLLVWTLGQEGLLDWDRGAIWLAASSLCVPAYLLSYLVLRDRTFGLLTALAGGSELLALSHRLGVPLEWALCGLVALASGYVALTRRLPERWASLGWALFWTAQLATPLVMATLMAAQLDPVVWLRLVGRPPSGPFEYAVGAAWWLGVAFYGLCYRLFQRRHDQFLTAWTLPAAFLFTLTKAPWDATWYNLCLALLALGYLLGGRRWHGVPASLEHTARQPAYQVGLALTLAAAFWPRESRDSEIATLATLSLVYGVATVLLEQRAWAYVATFLLPVVYGLTLQRIQLDAGGWSLAWVALSVALLAAAELAAQRSGEARRPVLETVLGRGIWRSRFASPLFLSGYLVNLLAVDVAMPLGWSPGGSIAARDLGLPGILALLVIVAIYAFSAATRRSSLFLYPASWLFVIAFVSAAERIFRGAGISLPGYELARLLALLGVGYLALGYAIGRLGRHYARPIYLTGYALSWLTALLSWSNRAVNVQVIGLSILVYAASAALARHPAWLYPLVGATLTQYLLAIDTFLPDLTRTQAMATLVLPTWLLFGIASTIVARQAPGSAPSRWDRLGRGPAWSHPWAAPLVHWGLATLTISTIGSASDARIGLIVAGAYFVLLALVGTLWRAPAEMGLGLLFGGVALQQGLRLLGVPAADQPPLWALVGLGAALLALATRRSRSEGLRGWYAPLAVGSAVVGAGALGATLGLRLILASRATLQPLAITAALTGLTLLTHGFGRRDRVLAYLGVALIGVSYAQQLVLSGVEQLQAFALPAGAYLLTLAYLEWRRGTGGRVKATLEIGGLTLLLGTSLLQAVGFLGAGFDRYAYDTFLLLESVALLGLGAVLRWRRTFFGASLALVADVLILLSDPLRAVNTWYLVAIIGLAMIGVVVFVEQRRQQIPLWLDAWRQRLESWD
ncbi:MAG: hypothetical protein H0V51_08555 [Chloroflexi bacterium]|nr:hypothetical protein [Chloroflexota bacterium]